METTINTKVIYRDFEIDQRGIDDENRTVPVAFSSETPYSRWFGTEILSHEKSSVDLSFIGSGSAPFLVGHWTDDLVGVVEKAWIDKDKVARAIVRMGKSDRAEEIFADIKDGIRPNISVGYQIQKMVLEEDNEETGERIYRVTKWKPLEISSVPIPADGNVGVGRSNQKEFKTIIETRGVEQMPNEIKKETQETAPAPAAVVVDEKRIREQARAEEQARIREITALGEGHGFQAEASKAIKDGGSVDAFRALVLEKLAARGMKPVEQKPEIGLTDAETKQFSFVRLINALANPADHKLVEAAAYEFEASRAVAQHLKREPTGAFIPYEVLRRDLTVGTDTAGGYLVSTDLLATNFIEMLRNRMMVQQLGAMTLGGLVGDVAIPKQTGGATAYWVAESGAPTESDQTVGQLALAPKTCGAFTDISRKLLKQSSIDIEGFVRLDLSTVLALALDAAAIAGTGADNQPTGILNTTGIGDVACGDPDGAAPVWADIVGLETEVAVDNADIGALAYLTNAKARGKLKVTEKATNTGQFVWENGTDGFGLLNGYRAAASNQVPSNLTKGAGTALSAIIFGNFSDLILALWGTVDILVDPYTGSTTGTVRVVALQDADIGVRHAESFAAAQDAVTT
jgi:HK97 family phage major capsid protein